MDYAFRSDEGLNVIYSDSAAYCCLFELDALAHNVDPASISSKQKTFDSSDASAAIRAAGWNKFHFKEDKNGLEMADLFSSCQYLASLPAEINKTKVLKAVAISLQENVDEPLSVMEKVTHILFAQCWPSSPCFAKFAVLNRLGGICNIYTPWCKENVGSLIQQTLQGFGCLITKQSVFL